MKYNVNEKKDNEIKIDFTLTAKEWEEEVERAYQKHKGQYKKEGFRNGNVPRAILEKQYGETLFWEDALNDSFPKYYTEMLKKEKTINPIDYPKISVEQMDKNGIKFSATVVVLPEFKVEKYTGIKVKKGKVTVSAEEVTAELESMRDRHARFVEITDREVKNGDLINLNFSGSVDGKKFDGGTAEDQELTIGSHTFIEGFEEQMIGMKIGEEKDLNVTFPAEYHSTELAGKPAVFAVKVLGIREKQLPELDDEFAKDVSEFDTLEALKNSIKEKIEHEKEHAEEHKAEDKLIDEIVNGVELEVPKQMIEKQLDYFVNDLKQRLSMQGLSAEAYFGYLNITEEQFREDRRKDAEKSVKTSLVLEEIVELEKIEVSEKEIDEKLEEISKMYGQPVDKIKEMLRAEGMASIKQEILTNKVINFLKEKNEIA